MFVLCFSEKNRQKIRVKKAVSEMASGFTVLEVIIVIGLSSILLMALLRFLVAGYPLSKVTYLQQRSTEMARLQLKRLTKAFREVRQSDTGAYPLVEMLPQRVVFYANVDSDPAVERVRYELKGENLERGVTEPTGNPLLYDPVNNEKVSVVASSIRNGTEPVFIYYSGNYPFDLTPLNPVDVTKVKYIQFHLAVDIDPNVDPAPIDVVSQVQLRNLKTNLGET